MLELPATGAKCEMTTPLLCQLLRDLNPVVSNIAPP